MPPEAHEHCGFRLPEHDGHVVACLLLPATSVWPGAQALSVKRRGPAWKPSSTSKSASSEPIAGRPSMRSSASLPTRPARTARASAASARCSGSASPAPAGAPASVTRPRPPRSTYSDGLDRRPARRRPRRRARGARRRRAARARAPRPWQRGAVGLRGVGGGEHECAGVVAAVAQRRARGGRHRTAGAWRCPQPLDGSGERELGTAHALDEVAPPADAERLEVAEGVVQAGEAAGDALGEHLLAGDDAVALEQQLGERPPALGGMGGHFIPPAVEDGRGERPAPLHLLGRRPAVARQSAAGCPPASDRSWPARFAASVRRRLCPSG